MLARPKSKRFRQSKEEKVYELSSCHDNYTHQTAPTQFVEANGIRFAHRRFGKTEECARLLPALHRTMDYWDPT